VPLEHENGDVSHCGYLVVRGFEFRVCFEVSDPGKFHDEPGDTTGKVNRLKMDQPLASLLRPYRAEIDAILESQAVLQDIVREVIFLIDGALAVSNSNSKVTFHDVQSTSFNWIFVKTALGQLDDLGWSHVMSVDDSFTKIELCIQDRRGRRFPLQVDLPANYPFRPPMCYISFPEPLENFASQENARSAWTLSAVFKSVEKKVFDLEPFFDVLHDFDTHCWVLQPENPTNAESYRRIAVLQHCSLYLEFDIHRPLAVPKWRFLGAKSVVSDLISRLENGFREWNIHTKLPRENLESILKITFPRKPDESDSTSFTVECGICYMYNLSTSTDENQTDLLPDIPCEHVKCSRMYHHSCLLEWLQSVPNSRTAFDSISGDCPYCQNIITIKRV